MSASSGPELSAILTTPDRFADIRRTVSWLRAQTVRDRIELVIVAPSREALDLDEGELEPFHGFQVVEVGRVRSVASGNAAGIRAASAPVVVLCEDHSYPRPDWAEALIEAHRAEWAAVGPVVSNANPRTAVSWADFLPGYGPWLDPTPAGEVSYIPGHNSSYKRDVLLELGDELGEMMNGEAVLHWELQARGHRLYLEPRAKTRHFNFSRLSIYVRATSLHARTFAAERARGGRWGPLRRTAYALAWPLIPVVRLRRVIRDARRAPERGVLPRALPPVVLGLTVGAFGEARGYLLGAGDAPGKLSQYEYRRDRHVVPEDRAEMERMVPA